MADVRDLLPFVVAPQWGAWEPVALSMILAGGAALVLAALASWRPGGNARARLFAFAAVCALPCGLLGVSVPLEQPLRVWEFLARPAFSSWTAWGAYLVPLGLLCALALLWRAGREGGVPRWLSLAGLATGCLVLAYATGEVRACVGREVWSSPWMTPVLVAAGACGAVGLALLLALRLSLGPDASARAGKGLSRWSLGLAFGCALLALLVPAPRGFAPFVGGWWHAPEALMALLVLCALAFGGKGSAALAARGGAGVLAAMLLLWKVVHMGEIFGRNASLYPAAWAFGDLVSTDALTALAGTAGLLVVLAVATPLLVPAASKS